MCRGFLIFVVPVLLLLNVLTLLRCQIGNRILASQHHVGATGFISNRCKIFHPILSSDITYN